MRDNISTDEHYMKRALMLARRGTGKTSPNPMVGAVIVKGNRVIGEGYHRRFGDRHAEINAIESAVETLDGATLYVTLEPCFHYGKTPPCVDAVIRGGFKRVVTGSLDPNPLVSGRSIAMMRQRGIEVINGVLEDECRVLNQAHFKYMQTGFPLVTLKFAQTLDGRIAAASGSSRWISSEASRRLAHKLRATNDAVVVGIGTILADDPELTVRLVKGKNPFRVVLDTSLKIPLDSKVLAKEAPTMVITTPAADESKADRLRALGVEVLAVTAGKCGGIDLAELLMVLGQRGITSVLVEGGAAVITSFLRERLADRLVVFVAPRIMGKGIEAVGDLNVENVGEALRLAYTSVRRVGDDLLIEARLLK